MNQGEGKKTSHDTGEPSTANLYSMSIAQLRSLPSEILNLHLQQRHAVLTGLAMEKPHPLLEILTPLKHLQFKLHLRDHSNSIFFDCVEWHTIRF